TPDLPPSMTISSTSSPSSLNMPFALATYAGRYWTSTDGYAARTFTGCASAAEHGTPAMKAKIKKKQNVLVSRCMEKISEGAGSLSLKKRYFMKFYRGINRRSYARF